MTREAYYTDLTKTQNRTKFSIDFADWLRTRERDADAQSYLDEVNRTQREATRFGRQFSVEQAVRIAEGYARVIDLGAIDDPHQKAIEVLSAVKLGGDTDRYSGRWDREEDTMRQMERDSHAVPVNLNEPEYPDVEVVFFLDDDLLELAARTLVDLTTEGYGRAAKVFAQDVLFAHRLPNNAEHLFTLIWSYVTVIPESDYFTDDVDEAA